MDGKVKLTLAGLDGNAFNLLGAFRVAARKQGFASDWITKICEQAMAGDYNHLLTVLMENTEEDGEE